MRAKQQLNWLVQALLLPAALAAALLIVHSFRQQRAVVEQSALETARALTQAVDLELASGRTALQVLATSPHLAAGDIGAFDRQARAVLSQIHGNNITLTDRSGQQRLNTLQPFGQALPHNGNPEVVRRVFQTGQAFVSDLYLGPVSRQPVIGIDVPVHSGDEVIYDLSMGFFPDRLGETLKRQKLPAGWVGAILDSQGFVVARTREAERYVGQRAAPALLQAMAGASEGRLETDALDGVPVVSVFSRSGVSSWSVAIGIPRAQFEHQLWVSVAWLLGGTLALLAAGFALARRLGERMVRPISTLTHHAAALGRGENVRVPPLDLEEADEVGRALDAASRMLRDREDILAFVSHDLRNPLAMLMLNIQVAQRTARKLPGGEPLYALLERMEQSGGRMAGMVDDLLAVAVSTRRRQSMLKLAAVSPLWLLQRSREAFAPLVARGDIELRVEAADGLPDVQADADRILRVFANLLDNAFKFTQRPGRVLLAASAQEGFVRFSVANSGPPLPPEDLSRMFLPFWQASEDRRGAGLGMAICRSIIETHGGCIWASAEAGMSVRIFFDLPVATASMEEREDRDATPTEPAM